MIKIGGLEKTSLLDYPGKVSAIIFTYGCNLRCPYCHNPELVVEVLDEKRAISQTDVLAFLKNRLGKLDAVVITGGEPLLYKDLKILIKKIKKLGYLVKLDTNGLLPTALKNLIRLNLLDYIAMDVKYPESDYISMTGIKNVEKKIKESIDIIRKSGIDYEFRTTYVKGIHAKESVEEIGKLIEGSKRYFIQNFRAGKTIDPKLDNSNSFTQRELNSFKRIMRKYVKNTSIR